MESKVKELERISRIAYGKIPVSEESAVFSLFAERREVCKRIINEEVNLEFALKTVYYYNELIKQRLWLS
jgi:hypothetical protein